jgi:peroxiredoxin Q/BCP
MRRLNLIPRLCFLALALTMPASVGAQQPAATQPTLKAGDPAPDFTLQASDGKTYSLSQLRGRSVVLAWFPKAFTAG